MNKYCMHFKTITKHKMYVMSACFKCGLIWRGLTHDLSKFLITEFFKSAKYFQGKKPITGKVKSAYSLAWQNHKAKNKHHWQYWTDFDGGQLILLRMPEKYVAEMLCDWVGAGKAYNKSSWSIDTLKSWYEQNKNKLLLHTSTKAYIEMLMKHVTSEADLYKNWISVNRICDNYTMDELENCAYQPPIWLQHD